MDLGIHTSWEVLEDKLEERANPRRKELTWNLRRLPELRGEGPHRLFVAVGGVWQGYFVLADDVLWNPEDARCPYSLLFDPRSWVEIRPIPIKRFRGFTYNTPRDEEVVPASTLPAAVTQGPHNPGLISPGKGGSTSPGSGSRPDRE